MTDKNPMRGYAIIPAAGRGLRMGQTHPKQFLDLWESPSWSTPWRPIARAPFLTRPLLVVPDDLLVEAQDLVARLLAGHRPIRVVAGGKERQDSVWNALCSSSRRIAAGC